MLFQGDSVLTIYFIRGFAGDANSIAFQLASLDDRGILSLWLPTEVNRDLSGANEDEPGLSLTGKIHLVRSRSLQVLSVDHGVAETGRGQGRGRSGNGPLQERFMNEVNWDVCF